MTIAKIVTKTLDIGVKDTKIDFSATIKSYDLTDTKFIFNVISNQGLNIDLTGSTAMYIVEYVHNSQTYAIQGDVDIVDSTTIAFSLPEDLKGYKGTAIIGLYVQMADGTKIDIKDIIVRIEPSIMDKGIDFTAKTYFEDFETVKAEVVLEGEKSKTDINAVVADVNGYADSQKQAIHNIVADVQSTGDTAKADINATLPSLQTKVSELKEDLVNKITEVGNLVKNTVKFIEGGYFNPSGKFVNTLGFGYTDYIDIGTAYFVRGHLQQISSNLSLVVWYDKKKNILSCYKGDGSSTTKFIDFSLKVPSGARYVRFSTHTAKETEHQYAGLVYVEDYLEDYLGKCIKNKTLYIDDFTIIGYISSKNGMLSTEAKSFVSTDYMDIRDGMKIGGRGKGFLGNIFIYCFYDKDYKYIKGYKGTPVGKTYDYEDYAIDDIPDNARYIRFSTEKSADETFVKIEWNAVTYTDYKVTKLSESLDGAKEFYVGYGTDDGKTYFSSLVDCLWKISETEGKKILYVYDGTYDVLEELGGMNYILSKNTTNNKCEEVHPFVTDTTIIGIGHVILNFLLDDGTPYENYWLFSCLGVRGNFNLENIEIHSKNCRYCIHDESGKDYPNTERHYKNVRCYQNENGGVGGQAIGCGFSARTRVYYENCYLESGGTVEAWSCHANDGCSFIFNNTIFKSKSNSHSLRLSQNGQCDLYASISNCFISSGINVRNEWTQNSIEGNTKIDLINTKVPKLVNGYSIINEKITSYNTVDGTENILLDITKK